MKIIKPRRCGHYYGHKLSEVCDNGILEKHPVTGMLINEIQCCQCQKLPAVQWCGPCVGYSIEDYHAHQRRIKDEQKRNT